jgi:hypothetical protein
MRRMMIVTAAVSVLVPLIALAQPRPPKPEPAAPAIGAILAQNGIPLDGLPVDPNVVPTSAATAASGTTFGIAWRAPAAGGVDDTIHVLLRDAATGTWSSLSAPQRDEEQYEVSLDAGPIVRLQLSRGYVYVDTYLNPSAGLLIVIGRDGKSRMGLWGTSLAVLTDERVLYLSSQPDGGHVRLLDVRLYQPGQANSVQLYPNRPWLPLRQAFIDRVAELMARRPKTWFAENDYPSDPAFYDSTVLGKPVFDGLQRHVAFIVEFGSISSIVSPTPERIVVTCDTKSGLKIPPCTEQRLAEVMQHYRTTAEDALSRAVADAGSPTK